MAVNPESPLDKLWQEYATVFKEFDDLKLARWMAQTLGQLEGRAWRLSHPLLGAYRLAAQTAYDRGLGVLRLATGMIVAVVLALLVATLLLTLALWRLVLG